jgi:hypothetical protein
MRCWHHRCRESLKFRANIPPCLHVIGIHSGQPVVYRLSPSICELCFPGCFLAPISAVRLNSSCLWSSESDNQPLTVCLMRISAIYCQFLRISHNQENVSAARLQIHLVNPLIRAVASFPFT